MNYVFFVKTKALRYSQLKAACSAHDPPEYCHTPPVGPVPHVENRGFRGFRRAVASLLFMFVSLCFTFD